MLVTSGLLTQQAMDDVLAAQKVDGRRLGELLAERGLVRPHQLAQFLSHQLACPWVSLQRVEVTKEAVETLPREIALRHHMIPVHLRTSKGATVLYVAMDDPTDDVALAEAAKAAKMAVKPMIALTSEIKTLLDRLYGAPRGPYSSEVEAMTRIAFPSITPKPSTVRATKPPIPMKSVRPPAPPLRIREEASILDEIELIEEASPSTRFPAATVLVIDAKPAFLAAVCTAAQKLGADVVGASAADARKRAAERMPCAIVIGEDAYDVERTGLDLVVLEVGAQLIVASHDFSHLQLEALVEAAIKRWRRSSYDKGTVLEGRYELLRDLGGRVAGSRWEVRHLRTARRSLLKVGVRVGGDDGDAEAVRREQMALARFQHPGAVDLRDAGNTEYGDPFVLTEMLEGRTLEGLVAARGALDEAAACAMIRQIADVLATAHEASVLHHEVRPENVLVVRDAWGTERVKLVHWESATIGDGEPEAAVDLAGLGACAFLALVGRARNDGEDVTQVDLPPALGSVIARSFGGASAKRFASARELVAALDAVTAKKASDPIQLLQATPERRGSLRPPPKGEELAQAMGAPPPSHSASELRRHPRASYRTPVRIEVSGFGTIDGRSEDISERGLFIVTRSKMTEGAQVTVRFALPIDGKVVSEAGFVRWTRVPKSTDANEPRAIGIELSSPNPETTKQIARYVSFMGTERGD